MKQADGFTLIEMLFILSLVSLFFLLTIVPMHAVVRQQATNGFFELLDADMLYVQNAALNTRQNYRISLRMGYYVLIDGNHNEFKRRTYPEHLKLISASNVRIEFNQNGTIRQPMTTLFQDDKI